MRLCFYNPQVADILGLTLFAALFFPGEVGKRKRRMDFLLDVLRDKKYETAIVVDGTVSSIPLSRLGPFFSSSRFVRFFSFLEAYAWCVVNRINPLKQAIIFSFGRLDPKNDFLFGFAFLGKTFLDEEVVERGFFKRFRGAKALHVTHFFDNTGLIANNVKKTGAKIAVAEVNLKNSGYFNAYFGFIDSVCLLRFVLREKYVSKTEFFTRKNKCVALGTLAFFPEANKSTIDHSAFFRTDTLHPMRKVIFDNRSKLRIIDSLIGYQPKPRVKKKGIISLFLSNFGFAGKEYHGFNIVDVFNEYRMFIASEENIGLPSVSVIEGMACGCAYVGLDDPMYADLGMKGGVHYIPYNGTIKDLVKKIEYYQAHEEELRKIAAAGRRLVREHFAKDRVIRDFFEALEVVHRKHISRSSTSDA